MRSGWARRRRRKTCRPCLVRNCARAQGPIPRDLSIEAVSLTPSNATAFGGYGSLRHARASPAPRCRSRWSNRSRGCLIGIAIGDGAIKSVDDTAETYVPGLKGTEYGATPLRALLHMSSGVDFGEEQDKGRDLDRLWIDMVRGDRIQRARSPASRNSTGGSRRRGRGSTTPASNPTCSASCCITPSTNPPPSICVKKSGSRSARKPTPNG